MYEILQSFAYMHANTDSEVKHPKKLVFAAKRKEISGFKTEFKGPPDSFTCIKTTIQGNLPIFCACQQWNFFLSLYNYEGMLTSEMFPLYHYYVTCMTSKIVKTMISSKTATSSNSAELLSLNSSGRFPAKYLNNTIAGLFASLLSPHKAYIGY